MKKIATFLIIFSFFIPIFAQELQTEENENPDFALQNDESLTQNDEIFQYSQEILQTENENPDFLQDSNENASEKSKKQKKPSKRKARKLAEQIEFDEIDDGEIYYADFNDSEKSEKIEVQNSQNQDETEENLALQIESDSELQTEENENPDFLQDSNENASENEKRKRLSKRMARRIQEYESEVWKNISTLVESQKHFGLLHNWGATWATLTRIQKKDTMSNFVWNDKMIGGFYELQSHDMMRFNRFWELNFTSRLAAYYPYRYRFRQVPQATVQTLLYGIDWFNAFVLTLNFFDVVRVDFEGGLHFFFQKHDMWNYINLGPGVKLDIEIPISSRWTCIASGMFSWDNGNLGSNRNMRPFDYVWEYQTQFGARYTKKRANKISVIKYKPKPPRISKKYFSELSNSESLDTNENFSDTDFSENISDDLNNESSENFYADEEN